MADIATNNVTLGEILASLSEKVLIPADMITGSGGTGYLAKFTGANTITNGPLLGSSAATFLRNDGTWATPVDTKVTQTVQAATATSTTNYPILLSSYASSNTGSYTTSTLRPLNITGTPSGILTASQFNAKSDARLKENFVPLSCEHSVLELPIYKYDYINGNKNQIGCKAQDLKEICPELVNEGDDGYLTIQESKIVYLLIDEVKKLKKEIAELKGE